MAFHARCHSAGAGAEPAVAEAMGCDSTTTSSSFSSGPPKPATAALDACCWLCCRVCSHLDVAPLPLATRWCHCLGWMDTPGCGRHSGGAARATRRGWKKQAVRGGTGLLSVWGAQVWFTFHRTELHLLKLKLRSQASVLFRYLCFVIVGLSTGY